MEVLNRVNWCEKCVKFYEKTNETCKTKEMKVLRGLYSSKIEIECKSKHIFSINYVKSLNFLNC